MARRRRAQRRVIEPDPRMNSELVTRVINYIMRDGKKSIAERIVYGAMDEIKEKTEEDPMAILVRAIDNIKPRVEVKSRRVGGATYQVPVEIGQTRQLALALRWLKQYASGRRGMPMKRALAMELMDAYQGQGSCVKKRDDTHKMAQANKAFAHYAW
jgi:small subunit ribosomal protein S7